MKHSGKKLYLQLVRTITNGNLTISSSNTNWALNFLTLSLVFLFMWVTRIGPSCHFHIQDMDIIRGINWWSLCAPPNLFSSKLCTISPNQISFWKISTKLWSKEVWRCTLDIIIIVTLPIHKYDNPKPWASNCA